LEREASPLAGFYAARISTTPTLQWMVLSPPYTAALSGIGAGLLAQFAVLGAALPKGRDPCASRPFGGR
ncbi:hypothetical protein, partial [Methylobacterium sp.]|uniref:hypothetical protein n=1 Tax=Methylobacterium sp. TaxID=409 RepID=UPI00257B4299